MRKSIEIKKLLDAQRKKVEDLYAKEQFDDAEKEAKGLKDLTRDLEVAEALETAEMYKFRATGKPITALAGTDSIRKMQNRALNKALFGCFGTMTDEEQAFINTVKVEEIRNAAGTPGQVGATPAKGGYLLPEQDFKTIQEFRRSRVQLKDLCSVIAVNARTGKWPTMGEENGELIAFDELTAIHQDDLDFGQKTFGIADYGDIIPVSNTLISDVDTNLTALIGSRFAKKAVNTENTKIMALINAIDKTAGTSYKDIGTVLTKTLDPALSASATILTNQSGMTYLDQLDDANKRPMLTTSLADATVRMYKGRPIVVVKDSVLANTDSALPFVIGSFKDYLNFYDMQGVLVAISSEAGFTTNATLVRAIERFGVGAIDTEALVYLSLTVA